MATNLVLKIISLLPIAYGTRKHYRIENDASQNHKLYQNSILHSPPITGMKGT